MTQHNNGAGGSISAGCSVSSRSSGLPQAHLWQPNCYGENPGAWEQGTGDSRTSGQLAASYRSDWRFAWTHWPCSETEKERGIIIVFSTNL